MIIVHGVGDTEPGRTVDALIPSLAAIEPGIRARGEQEIQWLPERSATDHPKPVEKLEFFPAHIRRADASGEREIIFAEVHWADLSRIGEGWLATVLGAFQVVLNLHHITDTAAAASSTAPARWLRVLLFIAAFILRGPVAALNALLTLIAVAGLALPLVTGEGVPPLFWSRLAVVLSASIAIVAGLTLWWRGRGKGREVVRRWGGDRTWSDFGACLGLAGVGILALLVAQSAGLVSPNLYTWLTWPFEKNLDAGTELKRGIWFYAFGTFGPITLAYLAFTFVTIAAFVAMLAAIASERRRPDRIAPLVVAYLATILQVTLWVLLLPILGGSLMDRVEDRGVQSQQMAEIRFMFAFQLGLLSCVGLVAVVTIEARKWASKANRRMPRLIVGRWIAWALIIAYLVSLAVFLSRVAEIFTWRGDRWPRPLVAAVTALATAVVVSFSGTIRNVIHIGMDLVSHFHRRRLRFPRPWGPPDDLRGCVFERRQKIEGRFQAVLDHVLRVEQPSDLVIVAHSQGTVIAIDILGGRQPAEHLARLDSLALLTMGSPLTHLYQHYFPHLYPADGAGETEDRMISKWLNVFRSDDPIGNIVDPSWPGRPMNQTAIGTGGHPDYWRDVEAVRILARLLPGPSTSASKHMGDALQQPGDPA